MQNDAVRVNSILSRLCLNCLVINYVHGAAHAAPEIISLWNRCHDYMDPYPWNLPPNHQRQARSQEHLKENSKCR